MQEPFERIAALEKALRELLKLWSDFAKPNEKQAAAWEELKSRRGQEAKITPQIAAAIVAHATNENERAARAALAGEKEAATSLMGMRVVSDPSVPVGEVHIRNIVPPAPAPVADEALLYGGSARGGKTEALGSDVRAAVESGKDVWLRVGSAEYNAVLAAAEKRGMERERAKSVGVRPDCTCAVAAQMFDGGTTHLCPRHGQVEFRALAEQPEKP